MNRETVAFVATIVGAVASSIGVIVSAIGVWYTREATKRRGNHRR